MQKKTTSWYSPSLNKEMPIACYGSFGFALLLIPTAAADYLEYERFQMLDALVPFINSGKMKVFSIDSINNESWLNNQMEPSHKAIRQNQFNEYVFNEVVPFIRANTSQETFIYTCGASFGALHSMNLFLKRPDIINGVIAMSGVYDLSEYTKGFWDEQVYFNSPQATSVDKETRELLKNAKEKDLYLSHISPLGVPFNTLKGTSNELFKQKRIEENKAGSSCPKRFLALSKEFGAEGICTASKKFQDIKLAELNLEKDTVSTELYDKKKINITEKSCLCVGLANASYLENDIKISGQSQGVVICPGPNLAYFDKEVSLLEMVQHIYGNANIMTDTSRPHFFIKELKMYIDYLKNEISSFSNEISAQQIKKWNSFKSNLFEGIIFYKNLFTTTTYFNNISEILQYDLDTSSMELSAISIPQLS